MSKLIVTRKSNIETDEDGNIVFDDDGIPSILDEEAVGMLLKSHVIQVTQVNQEHNRLETGVIFRSEVAWENQRCPAVSLEDPSELVWLSLDAEAAADHEEAEDETGDDYEDEDDSGIEPPLTL